MGDSNGKDGSETRAVRAQDPGDKNAYLLWRERRIYGSRFPTTLWRAVVGLVGGAVVIVGIILIPFPGPGWLIVFLGLAVLATEFAWAQSLLRFAKAQVSRWTDWLGRQPIMIRLVIGLLVTCLAAAIVILSLRLAGSPAWVPDWVPLVD